MAGLQYVAYQAHLMSERVDLPGVQPPLGVLTN
jgi:hypothetical protein